jgi:hypothetical protein
VGSNPLTHSVAASDNRRPKGSLNHSKTTQPCLEKWHNFWVPVRKRRGIPYFQDSSVAIGNGRDPTYRIRFPLALPRNARIDGRFSLSETRWDNGGLTHEASITGPCFIDAVTLKDNQLAIQYDSLGPDDPQCCPSKKNLRVFLTSDAEGWLLKPDYGSAFSLETNPSKTGTGFLP